MEMGCEEFGFVTVKDHGVDDALIRRTYAHLERFYQLPEEAKRRYDIPDGGGQRGYTGFGKEHAKNRKVGDLKEFWHVGREVPADHRYRAVYAPNVWPDGGATASRRTRSRSTRRWTSWPPTLLRGARRATSTCRRTPSASMAVDGNSILRAIHYPPLKDRLIPGGVRAAEHEDINLITLLCEGTAGGLELLTRDGEWIPVGTLRRADRRGPRRHAPAGHQRGHPGHHAPGGEPAAPTAEDQVRYSMPFFVHPFPEVLEPRCRSSPPGQPRRAAGDHRPRVPAAAAAGDRPHQVSAGPASVELFAVQPRVSLEDYASPESFTARHRALAERVDGMRTRDAEGRPLYPALAVWPEMVGAPLGVMGHLRWVRGCRTTTGAMTRVALLEAPALLRAWRLHRPPSLEECRTPRWPSACTAPCGAPSRASPGTSASGWWAAARCCRRNRLGPDAAGLRARRGAQYKPATPSPPWAAAWRRRARWTGCPRRSTSSS